MRDEMEARDGVSAAGTRRGSGAAHWLPATRAMWVCLATRLPGVPEATSETEARAGLMAIDRLPAPALFNHRLFHLVSDSAATAMCLRHVNLVRTRPW